VKKSTIIALGAAVVLTLAAIITFALWKTEAGRVEDIAKRAKAGDAEAQLRLGNLLWNGNDDAGLEPNAEEAERWLLLSAEQGHWPAQHALGVFYQSAGDHVGAYAWFTIADNGSSELTSQLRQNAASQLNATQLSEAKALVDEVKEKIK